MTRRLAASLPSYLIGGLVGLAASLAIGDPGPAVVGTPLLLLAALGALSGTDTEVKLRTSGFPDTSVEGDTFTVETEVVAGSVGRSLLMMRLPPGLELTAVEGGRLLRDHAIGLGPIKGRHVVRAEVRTVRWGRWTVQPPQLRVMSPLAAFEETQAGEHSNTVIVAPSPVFLHQVVAPLDTNLHVGDLVSGRRGSGTEFADIRPYQPGDDSRSLNWRVSNRSDDLWVNDRHPEHNGDVIILVDAQPVSPQMIDRAVRMAEVLLAGHARRRHRLGLINLAGTCRWIRPGMGERHRRQLLEQLVSVAPGHILPGAVERALHMAARPPAMLLALTPLLDTELAGMLRRLKIEEVDVAVVELGVDLPRPKGELSDLGRRLWSLDRDRLREKLMGAGIPTALWLDGESPGVPLSAIEEWRRAWRRARV